MFVSKIVSGKRAKIFWQKFLDNIGKEWMTPPKEGIYKTLLDNQCVFVNNFVRKKSYIFTNKVHLLTNNSLAV